MFSLLSCHKSSLAWPDLFLVLGVIALKRSDLVCIGKLTGGVDLLRSLGSIKIKRAFNLHLHKGFIMSRAKT